MADKLAWTLFFIVCAPGAFHNISGLGLALSPEMLLLALAVPRVTSWLVLARQMGGDARFMAKLITLQVIGAVVTFPLVIRVSQTL